MFRGYLDNAEIDELTKAALDAGLLDVPRAALLAGVSPRFVAALRIAPSPIDQFLVDLIEISGVERMADGAVPIVALLENAAFQLRLRGRTEAEVFERLLSRVGNVATGVPALPDPAGLPEVVHNERVIGDDDTLDLAFLVRGLELAKAVARITVPKFVDGTQVLAQRGGPWVLRGTAWLIAPHLAITNHHVANARRADEAPAAADDLHLQSEAAVLEFDFDAEEVDGTLVHAIRLVATSSILDYAILELADAFERPTPLLLEQPVVVAATTRMAVNIVQHPRGEHKQVAFRNNLVTAADATTLRYYTDTDSGSSGSPVCDDRWRVVALHRGARHAPGANYQGKTEAYINFGTQIHAILVDLAEREPAVAEVIRAAQPQ